MDELELIAIGAVFAVGLTITEVVIGKVLERVLAGVVLVCLAALILYLLRLSVSQDPTDFLAADLGVVLVVGVFGVGGLLPPGLADDR